VIVVLLCTEQELTRERRGLAVALARIAQVHWLPRHLETIEEVFAHFEAQGVAPDLLVAPDIHGCYLPQGIEAARCPSVILHIDSFAGLEKRAETSQLFDLSVVFHPSSVAAFRRLGREAVVFISHAMDATARPPRTAQDERPVDVAFVGRTGGASYDTRRALLRILQQSTHNVRVRDGIGYQEMLALYGEAKLGINISRDDYPRDANLRCFEIMGAGALLLTGRPSELEEMGFREGNDYVGYSSGDELAGRIAHYLAHPEARLAIAQHGQSRVLAGHTYDAAARRLLAAIDHEIKASARARVASPPKFSADLRARYYIARGHCSHALGMLAQAPLRPWMSTTRAATVGRLIRAVCGRLLTGQDIH
jgi:hypothetical protein